MKIVKKSADRQISWSTFWLLLATGALVLGIILGNAGAVTLLQETWQNVQHRWPGWVSSADLPVVTVNIAFEEYNQLLNQRETARREGVLSPQDSVYVSADVQQADGQIPVFIRLLPGLTNHLETDDKWNFELLPRDATLLSGTSHANLIDPADNNWLYEWAFLESIRREDLPAGNYQFVNLILNGDDKGAYALQEVIGPAAPLGEEETKSVVVSYDVGPLLETVSYFGDVESAIADPVTNLASNDLRFLQVAEVQHPLITEDPLLNEQVQQATALLRGFQSGDLNASQVFDTENYGRFLALADLWGAREVISPFNLSYIYNNQTGRLEPIAQNGNTFQREFRVPLEVMYQDPAIQAAYASAVAEYSDPAYLAELRTAIEADYEELEQALAGEYNGPSLWEMLANRQDQLRLSLRPTQPVIAQLGSPELAQDAIIRVNVANAINLPLEILGFDIDGATFLEADPAWIVGGETHLDLDDNRIIIKPVDKESASGLKFVTFDLPVTTIIERDRELDFLNEIEIQVATSILGLPDTQLTPASPGILTGG